MNLVKSLTCGLSAAAVMMSAASADERRFTYTYEPETLPAGAVEFENWITLRSGRSADLGKENYNRWDLRQELEFGITDRYTLGLYLNETSTSYKDASDNEVSTFDFKGLSLENRYNVLNPAEHAIGLTLYLEGTYAGDEAELEEKIIIGQRYGDWKWAFNLIHETEWEDEWEEIVGELGGSLGVAYDLNSNWSIGLELANKTVLPEYEGAESTAIYLGPVASYHTEKWWATLTVMPQIKGWNFGGDPDGSSQYELTENEKIQVRLLVGIHF